MAANKPNMDGTYGYTAEHFSKFDISRFTTISVLAPYEPKDRNIQWVRGSIRYNNNNGSGPRDLIVTGPKLKVCYGGCRWNRLVFAMNGDINPDVKMFESWLSSLSSYVRDQIWSNPNKYKPGSITNQRFYFDEGLVKPSSDPIMYPDELQTRLSTKRVPDVTGAISDIVDAEIFQESVNGPEYVAPEDITAGSHIIPIIKISYNRNIDKFGLVLTVLKAKYFPSEYIPRERISNDSWTFDTCN